MLRLKAGPNQRRRISENPSKLAEKLSSISEIARQTIDIPMNKVQDKGQEAITTKKQKAKSSESASRIEASKDARKTEAKTARIKRKDASLSKVALRTKVTKKDLRTKKPEKSAKADEKREAETTFQLSPNDTVTDEPLDAIAPVITTARAHRKTQRKLLKDSRTVLNHREKMSHISRGKIAPSLTRKTSSPGHGRDESQDILPAKALKEEETVGKTPLVRPVVQQRHLPEMDMVKVPKAKKSLRHDANKPKTSKFDIQTVKAEELRLARKFCCSSVESRL